MLPIHVRKIGGDEWSQPPCDGMPRNPGVFFSRNTFVPRPPRSEVGMTCLPQLGAAASKCRHHSLRSTRDTARRADHSRGPHRPGAGETCRLPAAVRAVGKSSWRPRGSRNRGIHSADGRGGQPDSSQSANPCGNRARHQDYQIVVAHCGYPPDRKCAKHRAGFRDRSLRP